MPICVSTIWDVLVVSRTAGVESGREQLEGAARDALTKAPPLATDGDEPTAAIIKHVRAARPRCSFPDCPRPAHRCDLDHDVPWPRGSTCEGNLDPLCWVKLHVRRHHGMKTRGEFRTRLHRDGSTTWTSRRGTITVTTRPPPLPGYAPGEAAPELVAA